jgi:hypothetical protein
VRRVDGATVTLPDTAENQAAYPQSSSQKAGLGFPLCRLVALLCLGSGALLDAATGPCEDKGSDEQALLRTLLETLQAADILLGDAYYATYFRGPRGSPISRPLASRKSSLWHALPPQNTRGPPR